MTLESMLTLMSPNKPNLNTESADLDRRGAERTPFEPLRARLGGRSEGIVVDLSETGARLQLPVAPPRDRQCPVQIEWRNTIVTLQARVVRSVQRSVQSESATLARTEYYVAIEFLDPTREAIDAVRRILQND